MEETQPATADRDSGKGHEPRAVGSLRKLGEVRKRLQKQSPVNTLMFVQGDVFCTSDIQS